MKKINLKGISEILSEKELKNVMGGSGALGGCGTSAFSIVCNGGSCIGQNGLEGECKPLGLTFCACYV